MEVRIRAEQPGDAAGIRRVVAAAFAGADGRISDEVGLVDALRASDAWLPELSVVAQVDGAVVAHALLSRVTVGIAGFPALALGPVAVLPAGPGPAGGTRRGALGRGPPSRALARRVSGLSGGAPAHPTAHDRGDQGPARACRRRAVVAGS
jgi:hypothetical protein